MKAVVMAGGEGTRLRPLTLNHPKPMVWLCNKPVMEYIIELLRRHGVETIIVTLHYLANEIISYFGDGSDWGVQLIYSVEEAPLGTAGSVKRVEQYLDETFMLISGDALTDVDLTRAAELHRERDALATLVLHRASNPLEYGVVITDREGRVQRFVEKPSWGEVFSDTINTGIYILEPEVLDEIDPGEPCDFSKDLFPRLLERQDALHGYVAPGYWCDIGSLQQYLQAHSDLFEGRVQAEIPGRRAGLDVWVGEGTEIHASVQLRGPVVVGRNCRIREGVTIEAYTVLGDNCLVEEGATIRRSIVWSNAFIGRRATLEGCTIARGVTIKDGATLSEGVVVGDRCFVGSGAVLHKEVKVWPDKTIEAGANLSMSLIWGIQWPGSLFGPEGISGLANIEITPEFALKLGAAYGASLEKGATVTTSRDAHPATRMLNRAVICGLVSVGCNVLDLRVCPAPIARYTVETGHLAGGIHCRIASHDPRAVLVELFDTHGLSTARSDERRIENLFFRGDFRRTHLDEVGLIKFPERVVDDYIQGLLRHVDASRVRTTKFKVVIDYRHGSASHFLPSVLNALGVESVALNAYVDPARGRPPATEHDAGLQQLARIVTTLEASLGVIIDQDAERLVVVDDQGEVLCAQRLLTLMCLLTLHHTKNAMIAVPITAPGTLESLAHKHHGKIVRTKTDGRSLMQTALLGSKKIHMAAIEDGRFVFPAFQPSFDATFAFVRLLELLAREQAPLSQVACDLPLLHQHRARVECPRLHKGRVMRELIEANRQRPTDLIEGLKVYAEGGWVLVLPDPVEPALRIIAEAPLLARAQALAAEYQEQIAGLLPESDEPARRPPRRHRGEPGVPQRRLLVPEDRAFFFWVPGRYLGVRATSLQEFEEIITYIDKASLDYHLRRGDFVGWLDVELGAPACAQRLQALQEERLQGEELRTEILRALRTSSDP